MKSLMGGLVQLAHIADLNLELELDASKRESRILASFKSVAPEIQNTNPEMFVCMATCLYLESQIAILPNSVRAPIMSLLATIVEVGKGSGITPSVQQPLSDSSKFAEVRVELLFGKPPTVMSHPKFFAPKGQPRMRAEALIGFILANLIRWPFTHTSAEGQTGYLLLLDIAATAWQRKWPSRLGGTWGDWKREDICQAANAFGWNAEEVWTNWLSVINQSVDTETRNTGSPSR